MKNFVLGVIATIFIGGVVYLAYRYGVTQQFPKMNEPAISPTALLVPSASPSSMEETMEESKSEEALIKEALMAKNNWDEGMMTITISTNDGKYASGLSNSDGGGGYFFAAKVNGAWKIVADGNGIIMCSSLEDYPDYPTTLIPECYDTTTDTIVKR